jgi:peptidyl-prolyl cis-trans isomerase A (cyclophilin A)
MLRPAPARALALVLALAGAACSPEAPVKKAAEAPKPKPVPEVYRVKLDTSKGDIVIEVKKEWAPRGAAHFHGLVSARFFDGSRFHRVIRRYVAQFGVNPSPEQNRLWRELKIPDDPVKQSNRRGWLSFAHSGPHTRATQVFINLRDNRELDKTAFAPFGKIVEGLDLIDKLYFAYGELAPKGGGPDAIKVETEGNAYLESRYQRLDYIRTARIVE